MTFSIPTLQHTNFGRLENLAPVFDSISEKYQALSHEQQIWLWIASIAGFILMIGGVVYLTGVRL
jgi:cytochrome b subunit of formate dehydrogenase